MFPIMVGGWCIELHDLCIPGRYGVESNTRAKQSQQHTVCVHVTSVTSVCSKVASVIRLVH